MVNWLKFFFLSFFSDRYAKEAAERRMLNALACVLIALVLLFGGLLTGYVSSFGKHYAAATDFREFAYSVFASDGNGVEFSIGGNKMSANKQVEKLTDGDGYALIIDTRPVRTTYDDFIAFCTDKSGARIDYAAWLALDEEQRKNYAFGIEYSGKAIDVAARAESYEQYFDTESASEQAKAEFAQLKEQVNSNKITQVEYNNLLYELYVKRYYPSMSNFERYGNAPTVRTYYQKKTDEKKPKSFLIVFENQLAASFVTSDGVSVQIDGTFAEANGIAVNGEMPTAQARNNVDRLMRAVFDSATSLNAYVYVINIFTSLPWTLIAFAVCSVMLSVTVWLARTEKSVALHGTKSIGFGGACKIVGMFMLGAGVISFVAAAVMSQFISRGAAFSYSLLCLSAALGARTLAFCIAEGVRARRKKNGAAADAPTDERAETTDDKIAAQSADLFSLNDENQTEN